MDKVHRYHDLRSSPSCVIGNWACQWKMANLTPQNPHPVTNYQKICHGDYIGHPYGSAKFGANPSTGASGQMGEI